MYRYIKDFLSSCSIKNIIMKQIYSLLFVILSGIVSLHATIHLVAVQNFEYLPGTLTVNCGDTIRFTWVSGTHPTVSETGAWSTFTISAANTTEDVVLTSPGSYPYYCSFHGAPGGVGMSGTITVICTPPSCDAPTGVTAVNVTSTSAKIKWNGVAGATKYQIQYRPIGTATWSKKNATGTSKILSGLTPSTTYQYKVKAICEASSSMFSSVQVFTTGPMRLSNLEPMLSIMPNPNHGEFQLVIYDQNGKWATIEIFDSTGKKIYTETVNDIGNQMIKKIILPGDFTGIAYVRVLFSEKEFTEMLLVE